MSFARSRIERMSEAKVNACWRMAPYVCTMQLDMSAILAKSCKDAAMIWAKQWLSYLRTKDILPGRTCRRQGGTAMPSTRMHCDHLLSGIKVVVFDAYGTVFDVSAAVARHAEAVGPDAARLSEIWRNKQLEYSWVHSLAGQYIDFWTLTERALDYALARCDGVDLSLRAALLSSYRVLDAYGDAASTLTALRAHNLTTAILSNGSTGMLNDAVTASNLTSLFEAVISVEEAGIFKTSPRAYALIETRLGIGPEATLFISSNRWDIAGANAFGLRTAWINRLGLPDEYPDMPPFIVMKSLTALLDAL
jgi:2-haloacid dehalogenase